VNHRFAVTGPQAPAAAPAPVPSYPAPAGYPSYPQGMPPAPAAAPPAPGVPAYDPQSDPFAIPGQAPAPAAQAAPAGPPTELKAGMMVKLAGRDGVVLEVAPPAEGRPYGAARVGVFAWAHDGLVPVEHLDLST
jgi:hypothetical protein